MPEQIKDRRKPGVHRTIMSDGNGGEIDVISMTATRVKVVAGAILAVLAILGTVFGAVRMGVVSEVTTAIRQEAENEDGIIHKEMHECAEEHMEEIQTIIQSDIDNFESKMAEQHDLGIRLEERLIATDAKVDANHEQLLREIRALRGGGS